MGVAFSLWVAGAGAFEGARNSERPQADASRSGGGKAGRPGVAPAPGEVRVFGVVLDPAGAAVEGATVTVTAPGRAPGLGPRHERKTGAAGTFDLKVPNTRLTVEVTHPDFAPAGIAAERVAWPPIPWEVRIDLGPGARLVGRILQKHGAPLAGMQVEAQVTGSSGARLTPLRVVTHEDGSFAFEHVPAGPAPRINVTDAHGQYLMMDAGAPGRRLREGEVATVKFRPDFVRVTGRLTRVGAPLAGAVFRLMDRGPVDLPSSAGEVTRATGLDGEFELFFSPGRWSFVFGSRDGKRVYGYQTIVVPDADDQQLDIALPRGETIAGRVIDKATGKGIPGALLEVRRKNGGFANQARLRTQGEGRFSIDLDPDDYIVRTTAWGYGPSEEIVAVTGPRSGLQLTVARAARIAGRVVGCHTRSCRVTLFSMEGRELGNVELDSDLNFRTGALDQEAYSLCAGSEDEGWVVVTGVPSGTEDLTLQILPPGRLVLSIRGPDGRPVAGALPVVRYFPGGQEFLNTEPRTSDRSGRLELRVPAGDVQLDLISQRLRGRLNVHVEPGATLAQQVTLDEASGLRP